MPTSQNLANQNNLAGVVSGNAHVIYASVGLVVSGAILVAIGGSKSDTRLLVLGIAIMIGAAGIAVDAWANSYFH